MFLASLCCRHVRKYLFIIYRIRISFFIHCYHIDSWLDLWSCSWGMHWTGSLGRSRQPLMLQVLFCLRLSFSCRAYWKPYFLCLQFAALQMSRFRTEFYFDCEVSFQNRHCCNCNICTFPCWKLTINYLNIVSNVVFISHTHPKSKWHILLSWVCAKPLTYCFDILDFCSEKNI